MAVATGTGEREIELGYRRRSGVLGSLKHGWWLLRRYPVIPVIILLALAVAAIIGPTVSPYPRDSGEIFDRHLPPLATSERTGNFYFLGTDAIGRDIFTRLLHGARISMQVVIISLTAGMLAGTALGILAGYYGGIFDELITRFVDIWYALPFLMVALVVTLIFGRGLTVLMFVLALIAWSVFVRVIRGQVLVLREMDYVASAKVNGASAIRIMWKHLLPGVLNTAIVVATLNTSGLILSESVLSFVGAGIQPPTPAWGVMTNEGRNYLSTAPWVVLVPGGAIFLVVISLNFLGDWLRDRLDPRLRQVD
ncbi:MAG: ABC transporter permease [Dehalococcoidia bacterium]